MRRAPRLRRGLALSLCCIGLSGASACDSRRRVQPLGDAPQSSPLGRPPPPKPFVVADAAAPPEKRAPALPNGSVDRPAPQGPEAVDATESSGSVIPPFVIDSLVDVAAAGPVMATERGVVMVNRNNQLQLAPSSGALDPSNAPRVTRLASLPDSAGPFPLARGPAVRKGLAYWVSRGRLFGQSLSSAGKGVALSLREDARVGTRVAVPVGPARDVGALPQVAAYIARSNEPDGPLTAKLWIEGQAEPLSLTDEQSSAHSVALAATPVGLTALFLEARTAMSSIHVRQVTFSKSRAPSLGEDRVAWVGGPGRPSTELFAFGEDEASVKGSLTLERDMTHFGLVTLDIPLAAGAPLPVEPAWLQYANGIEPAPFALASMCGRSVVALARPSSAAPHAPQELVLVDLDPTRPTQAAVVARSRAFFDISMVAFGAGALLAYVADQRTWARSVRCVGH